MELSGEPENIHLAERPYRFAVLVLKITAAWVILLVGVWFAWDWAADRKRRAAVARLPDEPGFHQVDTSIPDERNAAVAWRAAMAAVSKTAIVPAASNTAFKGYPPYPLEWFEMAGEAEAANAAVFPLADRAASLPDVQWYLTGTALIDIGLTTHGSSLNDARNLANTLADSALWNHFRGRDDQAVARLTDLYHLSDAVAVTPLLVDALVAGGITALGDDRLFQMTPDLNVGARGSEQRRRVNALIDDLASDRQTRLFSRAFRGDAQFDVAAAMRLTDGMRLIRPMIATATERSALHWVVDLKADSENDLPSSAAVYTNDLLLPSIDTDSGIASPVNIWSRTSKSDRIIPRMSRVMDWSGVADRQRPISIKWQFNSQRHAAELALVIREFYVDHSNQWPATLADLVPDEISEIPRDHQLPGSPPIAYLIVPNAMPDHTDRPMLFHGSHLYDPKNLAVPPDPEPFASQGRGSAHLIDLKRFPTTGPVTFPAN